MIEQRLSGDAPPERTRTNGEGGQTNEQGPRAKGTCEHEQGHTGEPERGVRQEERRPSLARRDEAGASRAQTPKTRVARQPSSIVQTARSC